MAIYYYSEAGELAIRKMNKVTGRGIDEYEGNNFRIGIFGYRGIKHPMQDRNCVLIRINKYYFFTFIFIRLDFFILFEFCRLYLFKNLIKFYI